MGIILPIVSSVILTILGGIIANYIYDNWKSKNRR